MISGVNAEIYEITQFFKRNSQPFLQRNHNIKPALKSYIRNAGSFSYSWDSDATYLFDDQPQPDKLGGLKLQSKSQFQTLYDYCIREKVPVIAHLSYKKHSTEYLYEFKDLIEELQPSSTVKLSVEILFSKYKNNYAIRSTLSSICMSSKT
ncbi:hypothetical protein KGF57_002211 [Candida theae]|uniref:Uncharacterized protein n=1 Tax=Candida theae TaxID=1198502 RepID=A0AAD5BG88_9ASCO|nr:uncharacterized protein KGF57_002211 [Candida theae]KAI5959115.1 hypothetical protein KGF57_002211 [Candida theae]